MQYYTAKEVMEMTGTGLNKAYDIIRKLNKSFRAEYPKSVPIQGKVLKWYFDEKMGIKKDCSEEQPTQTL